MISNMLVRGLQIAKKRWKFESLDIKGAKQVRQNLEIKTEKET